MRRSHKGGQQEQEQVPWSCRGRLRAGCSNSRSMLLFLLSHAMGSQARPGRPQALPLPLSAIAESTGQKPNQEKPKRPGTLRQGQGQTSQQRQAAFPSQLAALRRGRGGLSNWPPAQHVLQLLPALAGRALMFHMCNRSSKVGTDHDSWQAAQLGRSVAKLRQKAVLQGSKWLSKAGLRLGLAAGR